MNADEALQFIEELLTEKGKRLNDLQRLVFLGSWQGKDYKEIHQDCTSRCELDHLKRNVGYGLWKLLSEALAERVSKNNLQGPIERAWRQRSPEPIPSASPLEVETPIDFSEISDPLPVTSTEDFGDHSSDPNHSPIIIENWGDNLPEISVFYGRTRELEQLNHWIRLNGCRLLAVYGLSGNGKSYLTMRLAEQVKDQFEFLVWRSLAKAPLLSELLMDLTYVLSNGENSSADLTDFMQHLVTSRCLILLDGWESLLGRGVHDGSYQSGYEAYGELLRHVGSTVHQSCLVITSWDKPKDMEPMEGNPHRVCSLELEGLGEWEGRDLFIDKGDFSGLDSHWRELISRYWGNPFALNHVAPRIQAVFGGHIAYFLEQLRYEPPILEEIHSVLERQFERLSATETMIIQLLDNQSEPLTFAQLVNAVGKSISMGELQQVLQSLRRRSFIQVNAAHYALQPLVLEYVRLLNM